MRRTLAAFALLAGIAAAGPALANDKYHVYRTPQNECEIDTRDHAQMKSQRSTDDCLGHFDFRTDAERLRKEKVKASACKCPTGQSCS